ncbi:hypothetical protein H4217_003998 [Coemansia sp. RSA 1939]|nr:hypothetical protein H4217_003998 [Coemansia sp. RSA 1939]KAJ2612528.1 hypothetical protein EV177_002951 [Coemansia sp. RSA 1804]
MASKIKVVCRVRPFLPKETTDETVAVETDTQLRVTNPRDSTKDVRFSFDACYGPGSQQQAIYGSDVRPLVETIFTGMSATVFCYGVTGAGKTHTMEGSEADPGIIPRALAHVFKRKARDALDYDVRVSYYEIYKEAVFDLFGRPVENTSGSSSGLPIREDANRRIFVAGLTERRIQTFEQFETMFQKASGRRRTASTKLNDQSSRSHAILTVQVQWTDDIVNSADGKGKTWCGKLHLIDLAGSEDNRRTENGRDRMAESSAINRSLFVLGQVVEALNTGASRVPYRDSKMTRILQDSLGGECLGMMIVNVAPGSKFLHDTHNTLSFATKSREVVNRPVAHEVVEHRWSAVDRLQHHRAGNAARLARTQLVASSSTTALKRRRSHDDEESEADTGSATKERRSLGADDDRSASQKQPRPIAVPSRHSAGAIPVGIRQSGSAGGAFEIIRGGPAGRGGKTGAPGNHNNEIMERVMRIEKQLSESARHLDSNMVIDMFTPTTKLKTSRGWLKYARELEARGDLDKALAHYEEALRYAPELNKLETHIARLRARIRRRNRRSSIESHGEAAWTVLDGSKDELANGGKESNGNAKIGGGGVNGKQTARKDSGNDDDDDEDLGPLWMPDGLAESPGAEKAKRRTALAGGKAPMVSNCKMSLQTKQAPKPQAVQVSQGGGGGGGDAGAQKQKEQKRIKLQAAINKSTLPASTDNNGGNGKQRRSASYVTEGSVHDHRRISFGTGANNPFVVRGEEFDADLQERLDNKTRKPRALSTDKILAKSSAAARLQKRLAVPATPDDRVKDADYVPHSSGSSADESDPDSLDNDFVDSLSAGKAKAGKRGKKAGLAQQRRLPGALGVRGLLEQRMMMAQSKENVDAAADKARANRLSDASAKSRRGSGNSAATAGGAAAAVVVEEKLELGRFNDICLASALQMINSAEVKKITKLQGIGKRRAEQIQASIQTDGPLNHISELRDRLHFKNKIIMDILSTFA